jgi:hypothetical protein
MMKERPHDVEDAGLGKRFFPELLPAIRRFRRLAHLKKNASATEVWEAWN